MADFFPMEQRPYYLTKKKLIGNTTLNEAIMLKSTLDAKACKDNLGEEIFSKDGKPATKRYKAKSDNSTSKLHSARFNRQPLTHPKISTTKSRRRENPLCETFPWTMLGLQDKCPRPS